MEGIGMYDLILDLTPQDRFLKRLCRRKLRSSCQNMVFWTFGGIYIQHAEIIPTFPMHIQYDYFFIFKKDRHRICNCEIGNIDLSDHAPLLLNVEINDDSKNIQWRLNTSVLNDLQFTKLIKSDIKTFLKENLNGEVSPEIVWDTLKAVKEG